MREALLDKIGDNHRLHRWRPPDPRDINIILIETSVQIANILNAQNQNGWTGHSNIVEQVGPYMGLKSAMSGR